MDNSKQLSPQQCGDGCLISLLQIVLAVRRRLPFNRRGVVLHNQAIYRAAGHLLILLLAQSGD